MFFQVSNCQSDGDWAFFLWKNLGFHLDVSIFMKISTIYLVKKHYRIMKMNFSQKFEVKPRGAECAKIVFTEHEITTVAQFLFETCSGRAVCPLFKKDNDVILRIAEKRDERFIESHTIFLDFDNEQQTPQELISKVDEDIQASCAFSSYSDSKEKRKYHMFWLFEDALNKEQHKLISTFLYEQYKAVSSFEDSLDACSIKSSQMCFGTSNPLSIFNNNEKIFRSAEHFFQLKAFQQWAMEREEEECSREEEKHAQKANKTAKNEGGNSYINYDMCNDYQNKPWNEFAEKWGVDGYEKGWVNYRLEHEGWLFSPHSQIVYQYIDEKKYFQMPYFIHRGHFNESSSESIKHWLLQTMACYKLLNPRCDLNRILYRVLQKIELHNLNHNKTLSSRDLIEVMEEVDSYTEENIEERYKKRLDYLRTTSRPKSGIIIKKSKANRNFGHNTLLSLLKKELVLSVVDCSSVSAKQAHKIVKEKFPRLGIKLEWIQKLYCEKGFAQEQQMTKVGLQMRAIRELLEEDSLLSERKLLSLLKSEKGISIGRSTLQRRLKELEI